MNDNYYKAAKHMLNEVHAHALVHSGCSKVVVGSAISALPIPGCAVAWGANITLPVSCNEKGCMRVEKYGENSKLHRNPEDCRAVHSEIDAICKAARKGAFTEGKTIFVTRYPCEACARAIVDAGIKRVVYGRKQKCSDETIRIFKSGNVEVFHMEDWDAPDVVY